MTLREKFARWRRTEAEKLRPMPLRKKLAYILHYYRFWIMGLALVLAAGFYVGDAVLQSQREILLQGFFTNDDYDLFPAGKIQAEYEAAQALERGQRIVFDDALYIDMGGQASEYTAASNGKLIAYMLTNELDFVVTSGEVLDYYRGELPMQDLAALLPEDLQTALGDALVYGEDAYGNTAAIALEMTGSRYIAGAGAGKDPDITQRYYLFVPSGAPHPEQIVAFIRFSFGLDAGG